MQVNQHDSLSGLNAQACPPFQSSRHCLSLNTLQKGGVDIPLESGAPDVHTCGATQDGIVHILIQVGVPIASNCTKIEQGGYGRSPFSQLP